jgi:hypothetical protein
MIAEGQMVRFKPYVTVSPRREPHAVYMVLKVEGPDAFERMALILHPGGETSWQYPCNIEAAT